jgi:hypothetical protein
MICREAKLEPDPIRPNNMHAIYDSTLLLVPEMSAMRNERTQTLALRPQAWCSHVQVVVDSVERCSETESGVDNHLNGEPWLVLDIGGESAGH